MQSLIEKLSGKKTCGLAVALLLLAGADVGGFLPEENRLAIYAAVSAGMVAALRLAIAKLPSDKQAQVEQFREFLNWARDVSLEVKYNDPPTEQPTEPPVEPPSLTPLRGLSGAGMLLLCCLLGATAANAADIRIVGPSSVPAAGYPCELFVQGELPTGTKIVWDHTPKTEGVSLVDSADRHKPIVRLNTMAGFYKLIVAVTPPDGEPVIRYHDFAVPGSPYTPPQPPAPQPQPAPPAPKPEPVKPVDPPAPQPVEPVFEPGQFGMAELAYRAVLAVNSPNRRGEAVCLAGKISDLVSGIKAGTISGPQATVNAIATAFDSCLSGDWDTARDKLTDRVAELLATRRLTTMQHWQALATEALAGLNEAAKR